MPLRRLPTDTAPTSPQPLRPVVPNLRLPDDARVYYYADDVAGAYAHSLIFDDGPGFRGGVEYRAVIAFAPPNYRLAAEIARDCAVGSWLETWARRRPDPPGMQQALLGEVDAPAIEPRRGFFRWVPRVLGRSAPRVRRSVFCKPVDAARCQDVIRRALDAFGKGTIKIWIGKPKKDGSRTGAYVDFSRRDGVFLRPDTCQAYEKWVREGQSRADPMAALLAHEIIHLAQMNLNAHAALSFPRERAMVARLEQRLKRIANTGPGADVSKLALNYLLEIRAYYLSHAHVALGYHSWDSLADLASTLRQRHGHLGRAMGLFGIQHFEAARRWSHAWLNREELNAGVRWATVGQLRAHGAAFVDIVRAPKTRGIGLLAFGFHHTTPALRMFGSPTPDLRSAA